MTRSLSALTNSSSAGYRRLPRTSRTAWARSPGPSLDASGHHARPVRLPPSQQAPSLEELRIWRPVGIDQGAYCRIRYRIGEEHPRNVTESM
jgi:hypothetical protein